MASMAKNDWLIPPKIHVPNSLTVVRWKYQLLGSTITIDGVTGVHEYSTFIKKSKSVIADRVKNLIKKLMKKYT